MRLVLIESEKRGYHFDKTKLPVQCIPVDFIMESQGQLDYEWQHLLKKLRVRNPDRFRSVSNVKSPDPNPIFRIVPGGISSWESIPKKME